MKRYQQRLKLIDANGISLRQNQEELGMKRKRLYRIVSALWKQEINTIFLIFDIHIFKECVPMFQAY